MAKKEVIELLRKYILLLNAEGISVSKAFLFGSYSRGEDIIKSDIDIAIIGTKGKKIDIEKFEKILKKEVRINFYENWKGIHKDLKNNILNGIVLAGGVDL